MKDVWPKHVYNTTECVRNYGYIMPTVNTRESQKQWTTLHNQMCAFIICLFSAYTILVANRVETFPIPVVNYMG